MQEQSPLKWTLRLIKTLVYLPMVTSGLFVVLILLKLLPNYHSLIFMAAFLLAYSFGMSLIVKGLEKKKEGAWTAALIVAGLSVPSLLVPLAMLSLVELFDKEAKRNYFKKTVNLGTPEEPVYTFPAPRSSDSPMMKVGLICAVIVILIFVYVNFGGKSSSSVSVDKNLSPQQLYRLGADCNTKRDTDCSIAVFKRLLELDPMDNTALANLGMIQVQAGLHEEAVENLKIYFERGGQAFDVMAYYAQALNALGRQTEALSWYAQALAQKPNLIDVVEDMVKILAAQQRYQEGLELVERFIQKNPSAERHLQSRRDFLIEKSRVIKETTI